ncbi:hypothetical protein Lokhon_01567 [Limimaricola hongkongensis DSM 17492]|uniref:Uncharacterized protein n=1 Tax=Limimaricola hongkongensis DSM 17492 TaxID=1122180 RepID=A0A017HE15_9RHOB|nr:hypothetical protein Lokhon_01567 [Limimaricola hongkongensis DSM 17492]
MTPFPCRATASRHRMDLYNLGAARASPARGRAAERCRLAQVGAAEDGAAASSAPAKPVP